MTSKAARWGWVVLAVLIAGGVLVLRFMQLDARRSEANQVALDALADATTATDEEFSAAITKAEEAATEAVRESSALVDPWAAFLLEAVHMIESQRNADPPSAHAFRDLVAWHLAHDRLQEARAVLDTPEAEASNDEGLALWRRLVAELDARR